ncbi:unnamed protein product [Paramecium pentaurelia]|uniref:Uncharacterized protein n=1 Tax=Paramecium pentaurelia TaxID=43138 RepID=A0A8S1VJZ9_9CILI|nr:unnamed protein product [Paramecium pentaurelia]
MSSKKLLYQEIDYTKQQLSLQMSHQKTTLKEFSSYLKDYQAILKSISEQLIKLTRKEFTCREFENKTIKEFIDKNIISTSKISDILGVLSENVNQIEQDIFQAYLDIKQNKELVMQKCDQQKKERDQLVSAKNVEKQQIDQFTQSAIIAMQNNIEAAIITEKKKNAKIIDSFKKFYIQQKEHAEIIGKQLMLQIQFFDTVQPEQQTLERMKNQLQAQSINQSGKKLNTSGTGQSKQNENGSINETDLLQSHKDKLIEIRKIYASNSNTKSLPIIIKDQVGIFNNEIPYNMDLAKEFQQQEFFQFTLLMMLRYKCQNQDWPLLITHTKNKFKINLASMKLLELFSNSIQSNIEQSVTSSIFITLIKDALMVIKTPQLYNEIKNNEKHYIILKKLLMFSTLNQYWVQCLLLQAFNIQNSQLDQQKKYFNNLLKQIIIDEKDIAQINFDSQIEEISYPLNQCLLELILSAIIQPTTIDMDFVPLIYQFASDALKLSPAHVSITLLSLVYQKILQPALRIKNLDIKDAVVITQQLTEQLWDIINKEKIINQSQLQFALKQKNSDRLYKDLLGLTTSFWSQLPSDQSFLIAFMNLFYIVASISLEFTEYQNTNELMLKIMEQTGHHYYSMIIKREQFQQNQISEKTFNQVSILLTVMCKECLELKEQYIDYFQKGIQHLLPDNRNNQNLFFFHFMIGALSEIYLILQQVELCIQKGLIPEDKNGNAFSICFTLALIDDQLLPNNLNAKALQIIGRSIEMWFQQSQQNTLKILQSLITKEKFLDESLQFKELMQQTQTKSIEDFCSILFKSLEALQQVVKFKNDNLFKKTINSKMEHILYTAILMYLEQMEQNLEQKTNLISYWFPAVIKSKQSIPLDQKQLAQQQIHLVIEMMMRICNLNFLQQQFQHLKDQLKLEALDHLTSDFNTKGKVICKSISKILINEIISPNLFTPLHQDLKSMTDAKSYQQKSEWSMLQQLDEIKDFFLIFNQKLPVNYHSVFYDSFIASFFEGLFYSIFDINKLQNISQDLYFELLTLEFQTLQSFLEKQISSNVLQMRIKQQLAEIKDISIWFSMQNKDLIATFEQYHLRQDNKKICSALYRLILLRKQDSKMKDFAKKYQKIYE